MLYQIITPRVVCGIVIKYNIVIKTAPFFNWMKGKTLEEVSMYCQTNNYKMRQVDKEEE